MDDPSPPLLTYEDFRAYAAAHEGRFEYVDGHAVALASPLKPHGRIVSVLMSDLRAFLAGKPCDVYADMDVLTKPNARQPDIAVTCDPYDLENDDEPLRFPSLLIEVRSKNRGRDLTRTLAEYQAMPSVLDYVVIDSRKRWVRHYYRSGAEKLFVFDRDYIGGMICLGSIGYSLDIDALYAQARIR